MFLIVLHFKSLYSSVCLPYIALTLDNWNKLLVHIAVHGYSCSIVCLCVSLTVSVCLLVTLASPAKTAEPIAVPFGVGTWRGPRNHILYETLISTGEGAIRRSYVAWCYHYCGYLLYFIDLNKLFSFHLTWCICNSWTFCVVTLNAADGFCRAYSAKCCLARYCRIV